MTPNEIRKETLRLALKTNNGHLGSALSIVEILKVLYDNILKKDDIFILSKGHGCLSWYVILKEQGFDPDILKGHPDRDIKNGIVCTTGSEGHGLPIGVGIALSKKLKGELGKVYVLCGDGEFQEGTSWESLLFSSHHKLDNLVVIIDRNRYQALGKTEDILALNSLSNKITAFECECSVVDGHNIEKLINEFNINTSDTKVLITNTIKGKGISYMENTPMWHNHLPNKDELIIALGELECEENLQDGWLKELE